MFSTDKQHIEWIDWAKTIGLWLMVLGHGALLTNDYKQLVFSFHMPLFFILSGMFYKPISIKDCIKKDWYRLLLPYLIINFIGLIYWMVFSILPSQNYALTPIIQRVGAVFLGLGYNKGFFISLVTNPTWFLVVLFIIRIIMSLRLNIYLLVVCSIIGVLVLKVFDTDILVPIDSAMLSIPFFAFGYLTKKLLFRNYTHKVVIWIMILIAATITLIANGYNGRVDINLFNFGNNLFLFYLCGISGSLTIILLCKNALFIGGGEFASTIASGSLLIVGFNLIAISIVGKIHELIFEREIMFLEGCIIATIVLLGFYPLIKVAKRYIPVLLGMR